MNLQENRQLSVQEFIDRTLSFFPTSSGFVHLSRYRGKAKLSHDKINLMSGSSLNHAAVFSKDITSHDITSSHIKVDSKEVIHIELGDVLTTNRNEYISSSLVKEERAELLMPRYTTEWSRYVAEMISFVSMMDTADDLSPMHRINLARNILVDSKDILTSKAALEAVGKSLIKQMCAVTGLAEMNVQDYLDILSINSLVAIGRGETDLSCLYRISGTAFDFSGSLPFMKAKIDADQGSDCPEIDRINLAMLEVCGDNTYLNLNTYGKFREYCQTQCPSELAAVINMLSDVERYLLVACVVSSIVVDSSSELFIIDSEDRFVEAVVNFARIYLLYTVAAVDLLRDDASKTASGESLALTQFRIFCQQTKKTTLESIEAVCTPIVIGPRFADGLTESTGFSEEVCTKIADEIKIEVSSINQRETDARFINMLNGIEVENQGADDAESDSVQVKANTEQKISLICIGHCELATDHKAYRNVFGKEFKGTWVIYYDAKLFRAIKAHAEYERATAQYNKVYHSLCKRYGVKDFNEISMTLYASGSYDELSRLEGARKSAKFSRYEDKSILDGLKQISTDTEFEFRDISGLVSAALNRMTDRMRHAGLNFDEVYEVVDSLMFTEVVDKLIATWGQRDIDILRIEPEFATDEIKALRSTDALNEWFIPDKTKPFTDWAKRSTNTDIFPKNKVTSVAKNVVSALCFYHYLRYYISQGIKVFRLDLKMYGNARFTEMHADVLALVQKNFGITVLNVPALHINYDAITKMEYFTSTARRRSIEDQFYNYELSRLNDVDGEFFICVEDKGHFNKADVYRDTKTYFGYKSELIDQPTRESQIFVGLREDYIKAAISKNKDSKFYSNPKKLSKIPPKSELFRYNINIDSDLTMDLSNEFINEMASAENEDDEVAVYDKLPNVLTEELWRELQFIDEDTELLKSLIEFDFSEYALTGKSREEIERSLAHISLQTYIHIVASCLFRACFKATRSAYIEQKKKPEVGHRDVELTFEETQEVILASMKKVNRCFSETVQFMQDKVSVNEAVSAKDSFKKYTQTGVIKQLYRFIHNSPEMSGIFYRAMMIVINSCKDNPTNLKIMCSYMNKCKAIAVKYQSTKYGAVTSELVSGSSLTVINDLIKLYQDLHFVRDVEPKYVPLGIETAEELSSLGLTSEEGTAYDMVHGGTANKATSIRVFEDTYDKPDVILGNIAYCKAQIDEILGRRCSVSDIEDPKQYEALVKWSDLYVKNHNYLVSSYYLINVSGQAVPKSRDTYEDVEAYINAVCRLIDQLCTSYTKYTNIRDLDEFIVHRYMLGLRDDGYPELIDNSVKYIGRLESSFEITDYLYSMDTYGMQMESTGYPTHLPLNIVEDLGSLDIEYSGEYSLDEAVDIEHLRICDCFNRYDTGDPCTFVDKMWEICRDSESKYWSEFIKECNKEAISEGIPAEVVFKERINFAVRSSSFDMRDMSGWHEGQLEYGRCGYHLSKLLQDVQTAGFESCLDMDPSERFINFRIKEDRHKLYKEFDDIDTLATIVRAASKLRIGRSVTSILVSIEDTYSDILDCIFGTSSRDVRKYGSDSRRLPMKLGNEATSMVECRNLMGIRKVLRESGRWDSCEDKWVLCKYGSELDYELIDMLTGQSLLLMLGTFSEENVEMSKDITNTLIDMTSNHDRDWITRITHPNLAEGQIISYETYGYRNVPYVMNPINIYGGLKVGKSGLLTIPVELFQHRVVKTHRIS